MSVARGQFGLAFIADSEDFHIISRLPCISTPVQQVQTKTEGAIYQNGVKRSDHLIKYRFNRDQNVISFITWWFIDYVHCVQRARRSDRCGITTM